MMDMLYVNRAVHCGYKGYASVKSSTALQWSCCETASSSHIDTVVTLTADLRQNNMHSITFVGEYLFKIY